MLIKAFSDHSCPVDGGNVILWGHSHGSQNNGLPSIFINDPKHDGVLIAAFNIPCIPYLLKCFYYFVSYLYVGVWVTT